MNYKIWLDATRPKTLPAAAAPVLMGSAMAWQDKAFNLPIALVTLLSALLIQVATNFANDYFDFKKGADTDERLGPRRASQSGLIAPAKMKQAFIATFAAAFVAGLYLIWHAGWPILIIGVLSILFGILYTGGPYPLGYNGLGDVFVLIFFGPVAVGGAYYVQALSVNATVLIAGLAPGLISVALLTINNLRDIQTDRKAGKRTLAVRFGVTFTRIEYALTIALALLIPFYLIFESHASRLAGLSILAVLPAIPGIRLVFNGTRGEALNNTLAATGKMLFLYSLLFSIGWIF